MADGGQFVLAERALVMAVMAKRAQGPDVAAGRSGCPPRTAGASVAAKAGEGGLFGGRSLLVEWHGCMMSW